MASNISVWTGSTSDGFPANFAVNALGTVGPRPGFTGVTNGSWIDTGLTDANSVQKPLYAISDVITVIPEPGTGLLLGAGLLGLATQGRQRKVLALNRRQQKP